MFVQYVPIGRKTLGPPARRGGGTLPPKCAARSDSADGSPAATTTLVARDVGAGQGAAGTGQGHPLDMDLDVLGIRPCIHLDTKGISISVYQRYQYNLASKSVSNQRYFNHEASRIIRPGKDTSQEVDNFDTSYLSLALRGFGCGTF
jgi:hypothetical protein